jgi:cytochrome c oxidase subunit IV
MAEVHTLEDVNQQVRRYVVVFAALLGLTIVTVTVSYFHLSVVPAIIVALFIASIKGTLVASYFMHLISERKFIYFVLIITGIFFLALMTLPALHHADRGLV